MLIKASRITNLTDARYFAAKEVDFLGFNLEEGTEGYLDPVYMKAIREWVEGPKMVGEFSRSTLAYIREAASFFGLDAVQVTADYSDQLTDLEGLIIILDIGNLSGNTPEYVQQLLHRTAPFASWFLVRSHAGWQDTGGFPLPENALPAQMRLLKAICAEYPVLLQTDMPGEQLPAVLENLKPAGLSITGGEEEQVGIKSFDEIEAIFEVLGR